MYLYNLQKGDRFVIANNIREGEFILLDINDLALVENQKNKGRGYLSKFLIVNKIVEV